jgi:hypothetical protein
MFRAVKQILTPHVQPAVPQNGIVKLLCFLRRSVVAQLPQRRL